jgi:hypothetical protein
MGEWCHRERVTSASASYITVVISGCNLPTFGLVLALGFGGFYFSFNRSMPSGLHKKLPSCPTVSSKT